jgi:hypothetical protein
MLIGPPHQFGQHALSELQYMERAFRTRCEMMKESYGMPGAAPVFLFHVRLDSIGDLSIESRQKSYRNNQFIVR